MQLWRAYFTAITSVSSAQQHRAIYLADYHSCELWLETKRAYPTLPDKHMIRGQAA